MKNWVITIGVIILGVYIFKSMFFVAEVTNLPKYKNKPAETIGMPVYLGENFNEITRQLGSPDEDIWVLSTTIHKYGNYLSVSTDKYGTVTALTFFDGFSGPIDGIEMGTQKEEVFALLGEPFKEAKLQNSGIRYSWEYDWYSLEIVVTEGVHSIAYSIKKAT